MEKPLMTYIGRRDSDLEDALFERTEMAAVTEPKDVTEYMVRVSCMQSQGSKKETAASTLQNTDDTTRRAKTIPRNTTRYSNDSFGHCEEVEKQIRVFISHTWRADHKCDSDRRAAWTFTQRTVHVEEHTSFFKWTSKDDLGEVGKFAEWNWFRSVAKTSKLAEQWTDAHLVGKLNRANEQLLVIKGLTRSAGAGRKQVRDEKWNLGSQSIIESHFGIESDYRHRHISCQTGVHHESSVGRTRVYNTLHKR